MLEIRNIVKVYRSKTGEQVRALDNVSISFPETGMVFILGKSGSGKSTLLNVIGGLDGCDQGEFVIMGKSSKDFHGSDFDAYRNTFIGFIFQEYNILEDFSVGANIGLALELQGKKATDEAITNILGQVDLLNYAKRKPNELSGGQKQRIAIARALVKDPQIIMADEPTGALDSNTGKQIFDTLKELSKKKLVLVVSHDRDFAERYADRIIELADGRIISDVTKHERSAVELNNGILQVSDRILRIKPGYRLSAKDLDMINRYLEKSEKGAVISGDTRVNEELRSSAGLSEDGGSMVFDETNAEKDISLKSYTGSETRFIRSRLPMKNAVKIGSSGLKHKKFRLFMTILLSLVAFSMFGIADTMAAYNKTTAATRSIRDGNISNASFSLGVRQTTHYLYEGMPEEIYEYYSETAMNDEDIASLNEKTGLQFTPVFNGSTNTSNSFFLANFMKSYDSSIPAYRARLNGFVSMTAEQVAAADMTVTGRLPEADDEIAIPRFIYDQFREFGFKNEFVTPKESVDGARLTMDTDGGTNSIIGKHLYFTFPGASDDISVTLKIVGIVETNFDNDRYEQFLSDKEFDDITLNNIGTLLLQLELDDTLAYGFHTLGFLTKNAIAVLSEGTRNNLNNKEYGISLVDQELHWVLTDSTGETGSLTGFWSVENDSVLSDFRVVWFDGAAHTALGEKEYLISEVIWKQYLSSYETNATATYPKTKAKLTELFGSNSIELGNLTDSEWEALVAAFAEDHGLDASKITPPAFNYFRSDLLSYDFNSNSEFPLALSTVRRRLATYYAGVGVYLNSLDSNPAFVSKYGSDRYSDWASMSEDEKKENLTLGYVSDLVYYSYDSKSFGDFSFDTVMSASAAAFEALTGQSGYPVIPELEHTSIHWTNSGTAEETILHDYDDFTLVGYFSTGTEYNDYLIINNRIYSDAEASRQYSSYTETAEHTPGIWAFAIAPMPTWEGDIERLVKLSYQEGGDYHFVMRNQVMNSLESFNEFIEIAAKVFLYIGIGFAVFSSLLLMNFISVSISYKRHEIGILRAVGARSSDVFKIFFSESFIIALINYVLSVIATIITITVINRSFRSEGLNVTLLNFGIRQLILMLLISVAVAAIASFLPVWNIARRRPIDAIRKR